MSQELVTRATLGDGPDPPGLARCQGHTWATRSGPVTSPEAKGAYATMVDPYDNPNFHPSSVHMVPPGRVADELLV